MRVREAIQYDKRSYVLVIISLTPSLLTNTLFQSFSSLFGRFGILLPFLVFIQNPGPGYHLLKAVDCTVYTFVILYINSNHI